MSNDCPSTEEVASYVGSSFTWEQLQKLEKVYSSGVLLTRINNRTVQFQSSAQMKGIMDTMRRELMAREQVNSPCRRRGRAFKFRVVR